MKTADNKKISPAQRKKKETQNVRIKTVLSLQIPV